MDAPAWQPIGGVEPDKLADARRQAHNAAQWLVRMPHSFMPTATDNRHTLLEWDGAKQALVTQEFLPSLTLELRLPGLAMQFREGGRPAPHVFEFDDRTPAEAEAWVLVELLHRQLDRDRFSTALPYEFPDLMTGDAVPYVVEPLEAALGELAAWFRNATAVLGHVANEHAAAGCGAELVRCWPQTFHLGVLLPLGGAESASRRMLRAGFSPGDARQTAPHFYVAIHDPAALARRSPDRSLTAAALAASSNPAQDALGFLAAEIEKHRAAK